MNYCFFWCHDIFLNLLILESDLALVETKRYAIDSFDFFFFWVIFKDLWPFYDHIIIIV